MPLKKKDTIPCPYCGEMIERDAKSCSFCGSDEQTGWSDQTYLDGIDIDESFDYEQQLSEDFPKSNSKSVWWKSKSLIIGIVSIVAFILFSLRTFL